MKKQCFTPILLILIFTSCVKNYTCKCANETGDIVTLHSINEKSDKKAENKCNEMNGSYDDNGVLSSACHLQY